MHGTERGEGIFTASLDDERSPPEGKDDGGKQQQTADSQQPPTNWTRPHRQAANSPSHPAAEITPAVGSGLIPEDNEADGS